MLALALLLACVSAEPDLRQATSAPLFPGRFVDANQTGRVLDVVAADLNDDGHMDVVSMSGAPTTSVSVLLGDGHGALEWSLTKEAPAEVPHAQDSGRIAVLDVDGDGSLDVVTSGTQRGSAGILLVFTGDGAGGLEEAWPIQVPGVPGRLAVADMDQDGLDDLVAQVETRLAVLLRLPAGGFAPLATYQHGGFGPFGVGDVNGDLYPDALVLSAFGHVWLLLNAGNGSLLPLQVVPTTGTASDLDVGDLDGDGFLDMVRWGTIAPNRQELSVHPGDGQGSFGEPLQLELEDAQFKRITRLASGRQDEVVVRMGGLVWRALVDSGGLELAEPFHSSSHATEFAVADLDEDGSRDWIVAHENEAQRWGVCVFRGVGDGTLDGVIASPSKLGGSLQWLCDLDQDGHLDVLGNSHFRPDLFVRLGDGGGRFRPASVHRAGGNALHVLPGDYDGDGDQDLLVLCHQPYAFSLLLGDGTGRLSAPQQIPMYSLTMADGGGMPVSGDVDGDGRPEAVQVVPGRDALVVFGADTDGRLGYEGSAQTPGAIGPLQTRDVDGDGTRDIVYVRQGPQATVELWAVTHDSLLGWGHAFPLQQLPVPWLFGHVGRPWTDAIHLDDFDGDGLGDVLALRSFDLNSWPTLSRATQAGLWRGLPGGGWTLGALSRLDGESYGPGPADLDGDGRPEVALALFEQQGWSLAIWRVGPGGLTAEPERYPFSAIFADVNGDGRTDAIGGSVRGLVTYLNLSGRSR